MALKPTHSKKPKVTSNKGRLKASAVILSAVVVLGIAIVAFWDRKSDDKPAEEHKPTRTKKIISETNPSEANKEPVSVPAKEDPKQSAKFITMKSMTPDERAALREEELAARPIDLNVPTNRIVNTATEQIMGWIFRTEVGELPPPLPKVPDHELLHMAEILIADNPIFDTDSEMTADAKETIMLAKKELAEYIKNGGEVQEFFRYYRGILEQAYKKRQVARQSIQQILREEPDIALEYIDRVNEQLAQDGIKKITIHPKQLQHFGITE